MKRRKVTQWMKTYGFYDRQHGIRCLFSQLKDNKKASIKGFCVSGSHVVYCFRPACRHVGQGMGEHSTDASRKASRLELEPQEANVCVVRDNTGRKKGMIHANKSSHFHGDALLSSDRSGDTPQRYGASVSISPEPRS